AGRQRAQLDADVPLSRGIVDDAVPGPDGAVVQTQRIERRRPTFARPLLGEDGQERSVQGDALLEELERTASHPTVTERDARRPLETSAGDALVHRLPKERNAGLLPQPPSQQE